jgi:hypothetical protein
MSTQLQVSAGFDSVEKIEVLPLPGFNLLWMSGFKEGAAITAGEESPGEPNHGKGGGDQPQMSQAQPSG